MSTPAVRVKVSGLVQGVGYRAWSERQALARGLRGWVRNRTGGSVEMLLIGDKAEIEAMVAAAWQGPRHATVTAVATEPADDDGSAGFRALPTV